MAKIALWLLNRVAHPDWDRAAMCGALAEGRLGPHQVTLGTRAGCETGVLMNETDAADEYFIPIPVKCLGDSHQLGLPADNPTMAEIEGFYRAYFGPQAPFPWYEYWDAVKQRAKRQANPRKTIFADLRMVSPRGEGYYRALQLYSAAHPDTRHVVVGYSQGGLVARYLAYLDEQLFGDRGIIHGIVTIESPNFGSPLARRENADPIAQALALVAVGFAQLDEASYPLVAAQLRGLSANHEVGMDWLLRLLDGALLALQGNPDLKQRRRKLFEFLETARKWLSGLDSSPNPVFAHEESAFYDLDIGLLAQPGSVLHAINAFPLQRIMHGAVVGTDDKLDSFVEAAVLALAEGAGFFERVGLRWAVNHFREQLRQALEIPGAAYRPAMSDRGLAVPPPPEIDARLRDFDGGVGADDPRYAFETSTPIGPRAHDFVIPSAYQLIEKKSGTFLGNWVNPDASHLSGADTAQAGKVSQSYLLKMLRQM